jgi:hypothetical protein
LYLELNLDASVLKELASKTTTSPYNVSTLGGFYSFSLAASSAVMSISSVVATN